jgi:molybdate transport repressor ModE-like protein
MIQIKLVQRWTTTKDGALDLDERLLPALEAIQTTGSISQASTKLGVSYRFLWGLILRWGDLLGSSLALLERGRGAKLTLFGEKLLWADKRIAARMSPLLDSMASELELELQPMVARGGDVARIHASHGFAVEALREEMAKAAIPLELKSLGSRESLASLADGKCDLAGFHVPIGDLEAPALAQFMPWLNQSGFVLIELATRQQGLMTLSDNPKRIRQLRDLAKLRCRFVNRQTGSGTRLLFDLLLEQEAIESNRITGYDVVEYTHAAVAAFVASGMADVGFGIETGARRFGLHFIPLAKERYFFLCRRSNLPTPAVAAALQIMQGDEFKHKVNALPGYRADNCGNVATIEQVFPDSTTTSAIGNSSSSPRKPQRLRRRRIDR